MIKKIFFAAIFSGAALAAQAQSVGFSVVGTISPSSCTLSLGHGGVNDFGNLSKASLPFSTAHGAYTPVSPAVMPLSVVCPAPTKFALAFTDNRDGTAIRTPEVPEERHFGLGTYNGKNIGNVRFYAGRFQIKKTAEGARQSPGRWLETTGVAGSNSSWSGTSSVYFPKGKSIVFTASATATAPDALTEIYGEVSVGVNLDKSLVDAATSDIRLDGSGTVTLILL
jgi:hypothetical protein